MRIQVKMGDIHMLKKDWQVAILAYDTCKGKDMSPRFYMNLAECYQHLDQFDSALENLNSAVEKFEKKGEYSSNINEYSRCLYTRGLIHHRKLNLEVRDNLGCDSGFLDRVEFDEQIRKNPIFQLNFRKRQMLPEIGKTGRVRQRFVQGLQILQNPGIG